MMWTDVPTAIEEETSQNSSIINVVQRHNQVPLMVTATMLGMVSLLLLVVAAVAGIYIGYRLYKCDKKAKRYRSMIQSIPIFK